MGSYKIKPLSFGWDTSDEEITAWKTWQVHHKRFLRRILQWYQNCSFALVLGLMGLMGIRLFHCWMLSRLKSQTLLCSLLQRTYCFTMSCNVFFSLVVLVLSKHWCEPATSIPGCTGWGQEGFSPFLPAQVLLLIFSLPCLAGKAETVLIPAGALRIKLRSSWAQGGLRAGGSYRSVFGAHHAEHASPDNHC